jgi:hypothetical protein
MEFPKKLSLGFDKSVYGYFIIDFSAFGTAG